MPLCPELIEPLGVGLHVADEVFRFESAEGTKIGGAFGEAVLTVPAGNFAANHHGLRMP